MKRKAHMRKIIQTGEKIEREKEREMQSFTDLIDDNKSNALIVMAILDWKKEKEFEKKDHMIWLFE